MRVTISRRIYHLNENTEDHDKPKKVGRRVRQLIIACKCQLERDTEALKTIYGSDRNQSLDRTGRSP